MKNKLLIFLSRCRLQVALPLLALLPSLSMPALGDQEGDFQFQIIGDGAEITRYVGPGGAVVIPDHLGERPVLIVGLSAFEGIRNLASVTIPSGVTNLGPWAFMRCTGMTNVSIPSSVTTIGNSAFYGCTSLKSVSIPDGVAVVDNALCYGCTNLANVSIGSGVTSIREYAFKDCLSLANVTIPDSVASIGSSAFYGCASLTSVSLPNRVTWIQDYAFYGCILLKNLTVPSSVTDIWSHAFAQCAGLTNVSLSDGLRLIGGGAFFGCSNLTTLTIPDSVEVVAPYAFFGCSSLTSVKIGRGVTEIRECAFSGCIKLVAFEVDPGNQFYTTQGDGVLLSAGQSELVAYPGGRVGNYRIPISIQTIRDCAFFGCDGLTAISIPASVSRILQSDSGSGAFSGCRSLTAIDVDPENPMYTSVQGVLFDKDEASLLAYPGGRAGSYAVPDGVTTVADYSFYGCAKLTSVVVPNSVLGIGCGAFAFCTGLTNINLGTSLTSLGRYCLFRAWAGPGSGAFEGCTGLTSITIPDAVSSIGPFAFMGCRSLVRVTVGTGVRSFGICNLPCFNSTFEHCANLTSVYFQGDAPTANVPGTFANSPFVTVFYPSDTSGWGDTYADRPTAVWVPRPTYPDWVVATGLAVQFPGASGEGDDPDGDGVSNHDEWFAGTDPTQRTSRLELELTPRTADLVESDRTSIPTGEHAVYFRSAPGRYYAVHETSVLGGAWELKAVRVADTRQTRFLLPQPNTQAFYRIVALP